MAVGAFGAATCWGSFHDSFASVEFIQFASDQRAEIFGAPSLHVGGRLEAAPALLQPFGLVLAKCDQRIDLIRRGINRPQTVLPQHDILGIVSSCIVMGVVPPFEGELHRAEPSHFFECRMRFRVETARLHFVPLTIVGHCRRDQEQRVGLVETDEAAYPVCRSMNARSSGSRCASG